MTHDPRIGEIRVSTTKDMIIGAAQAYPLDADKQLAIAGLRLRPRNDVQDERLLADDRLHSGASYNVNVNMISDQVAHMQTIPTSKNMSISAEISISGGEQAKCDFDARGLPRRRSVH
jgi:hypothetical protein